MRDGCDAAMRCACMRGCDAECYVTGRYGTERKSLQDPDENPSVPDWPGPVDNPESIDEEVAPRGRRPSLGEDWEERFRSMERAGHSLTQIADAFGVSVRTASRWRGRLNLRHQAAHTARPQSDRDRAAALLDEDCSLEEVARTLGVTGPTIRRWFPDHPAWTREEIGRFAGQARRLNQITNITHMRSNAGRKSA